MNEIINRAIAESIGRQVMSRNFSDSEWDAFFTQHQAPSLQTMKKICEAEELDLHGVIETVEMALAEVREGLDN